MKTWRIILLIQVLKLLKIVEFLQSKKMQKVTLFDEKLNK